MQTRRHYYSYYYSIFNLLLLIRPAVHLLSRTTKTRESV